jgi:hypothetical protein
MICGLSGGGFETEDLDDVTIRQICVKSRKEESYAVMRMRRAQL